MRPAQKSQPKPKPLHLVFEANREEPVACATPVTVTLANTGKLGSQELMGGLEQAKETPKKEEPSTPAVKETPTKQPKRSLGQSQCALPLPLLCHH